MHNANEDDIANANEDDIANANEDGLETCQMKTTLQHVKCSTIKL